MHFFSLESNHMRKQWSLLQRQAWTSLPMPLCSFCVVLESDLEEYLIQMGVRALSEERLHDKDGMHQGDEGADAFPFLNGC